MAEKPRVSHLPGKVEPSEIGKAIKIIIGDTQLSAHLNETNTAAMVAEILPITASVNLWGEEIYFPIPLETGLENARETVSLGDIAYWPQGNAMCLFFGQTPVSTADEIKPLSAVNIIGVIEGNLESLKQVRQGETITINE